MKIFIADEWIKWKDIKRCPFPPFRGHPEFANWIRQDDRRLLLIALDRYADFLQEVGDERNNQERNNS